MANLVSIHALAWRATLADQRQGSCVDDSFNPRPRVEGDGASVEGSLSVMFQSTPSRGGRRAPWTHTSLTRCFNPRPRVEGDAFLRGHKRENNSFQSTPSRGGRRSRRRSCSRSGLFQSTPSRGGRHDCPCELADDCEFQSTPSRGGRPKCLAHPEHNPCFNPRPRVEGDWTH